MPACPNDLRVENGMLSGVTERFHSSAEVDRGQGDGGALGGD